MGFLTREEERWWLYNNFNCCVRHKILSKNHAMADVMKTDLLWNIRKTLENRKKIEGFLKCSRHPDWSLGHIIYILLSETMDKKLNPVQ